MFYNTTNETNPELKAYREKAMKQDDVIMLFFETAFNPYYTPSEVWQGTLPNAPLTSIRRSITNLTDDGRLVKTQRKRKGLYGRPEYIWTLPEASKQMELSI